MSLLKRLPIIRGKYREKAKLSKMSWFKTGGDAEVLFIPQDLEDLVNFLQSKPGDIDVFILGAGSNILIRDGGVKGITIKLMNGFNNIAVNDGSNNQIVAGASTLDKDVAIFAYENGIEGMEFLYTIPGSIGGALSMNAGAYSSEVSDILITAKAINLKGEIKTFTNDEIGYHYRGNALSKEWIFVEAVFSGKRGDKKDILYRMQEMDRKRSSTQPIRSSTTGSVFKNPKDKKAWELINGAGCKGVMIGGAIVSELHCNFIVNTGTATSADIEALVIYVKERVFEKYGIILEEEMIYVGQKERSFT